MHHSIKEFVDFILSKAPQHNKFALVVDCVNTFNLIKDRSVFHNDYFAVRFSSSKDKSFSNTILSLSHLEKYDHIPFFVVLCSKSTHNLIYLANSTFLKKISHSSKELSMTNIKGSFNGSDIFKEIYGMTNSPDNFEELFSIHQGLEWNDNLQRLVECTNNIVGVGQKFQPTDSEVKTIYNSITRAQRFVSSQQFNILKEDLDQRCNNVKDAILVASHIDNVNIRGRLIEAIITADDQQRTKLLREIASIEKELPSYDSENNLGDYIRRFDSDNNTYTDIKTKVIYLNSSPKAYNIDKFLQVMSEPDSIFMFFFIAIDDNNIINTVLCSVFHNTLIDASIIQNHWSGRNSRGTVQLQSKTLNEIVKKNTFVNKINSSKATEYLCKLLAL